MSYQDITQYNAACYTSGRPYGITSITIHWWGDPNDHPTFEGVIQTFTSGARGTSAHYVAEAGRVACLVAPGDRAWACGDGIGINSGGNDKSISIECNPRQSDGDYQTIAELVRDLRAVYGDLPLYPHNHWFNTACPGSYDLGRIDRIARGLPDTGHAAPVPAQAAQPALLATHVHYRLRQQSGGWLDEVTDYGPGDNGFAGMPCSSHDLLTVRVDEGSLRYRTHLLGGGWQDWVDHSDINDTVNGCAGVPGQAIDGVQLYYTTPAGRPLFQAWYRGQTASRQGWLPVVCDDGTSCGGDTFAGMYGEPLDRLQIAITDQDPYQ